MSLLSEKFGAKLGRIAALRPAKSRTPRDYEPIDNSARDAEALTGLFGATVARNNYGEHLSIRRWFPTPEQCFEAGDPRAATALRLLLPMPDADPSTKRGQKPQLKFDSVLQTKPQRKLNAKSGNANIERFALDPAHWLFLDTETTGLSGGSGTYPFLVGLAWWDSGGLQVEQFFMRDFSEEHAMLLSLSERLAERRVLVTFNGKSFDWPLLDTRFRMTRSIETPKLAFHFDFLHPARQLWKSRLDSVRLSDLEREILRVSLGSRLDWSRDTDIDSSRIPEIYFNFVRQGAAHPLLPVIHHNQMDLRGLAAIAARIIDLLSLSQQGAAPSSVAREKIPHEPPAIDHDASDLFGLARLLDRRRQPAAARAHYKSALAAGLPPNQSRAARRELARLSKRAGDHTDAVIHWESLLDTRPTARTVAPTISPISEFSDLPTAQSLTLERILLRGAMSLPKRLRNRSAVATGRDAGGRRAPTNAENFAPDRLREILEACEQLAIHAEHREKNPDRAAQLANHALAVLARAASNSHHHSTQLAEGSFSSRMESRFRRRLFRLNRKLLKPIHPS